MHIRILICLLVFSLNALSQGNVLSVSYDKVNLLRASDGQKKQKLFYRNGQVVKEVNYRHNNETKNICSKFYYEIDSVLIICGDTVHQYYFKEGYSISQYHWFKNQNKYSYEVYHPNGQLKERKDYALYKFSYVPGQETFLDYCDSKPQKLSLTRYDENGKLLEELNYKTGNCYGLSKEKMDMLKQQLKLKKIADRHLKKSYGSKFFDALMELNYSKTSIYDEKAGAYHKNNGMPDRRTFQTWFSTRHEEIQYIDFFYDLKIAESTIADKDIVIRLDRNGKLITLVDYSKSLDINFTEGLSVEKAKLKPLKSDALISYLNDQDIAYDPKDLELSLTWIAKEKLGYQGDIFYQLRSNFRTEETDVCFIKIFDEVLINARTMKIDINKDKKSSECEI